MNVFVVISGLLDAKRHGRCLIVLFVLLYSNTLLGQFSIGINGGKNYSLVKSLALEEKGIGDVVDGQWNAMFFSLAIYYNFNDYFALGSEPRFIERGHKILVLLMNSFEDAKITLSYLDIPIYAKFKYPEYVLKPFLLLGAGLSYFRSAQTIVDYHNGNFVEFNSEDDFKTSTVFGEIAIGMEYNLVSDVFINMQSKYYFDLQNISFSNDFDRKIYSVLLLIGVDYKF